MTTEEREPVAAAMRMLVAELERLSQLHWTTTVTYQQLHESFRRVANRFDPHPDTCDHPDGLIEYVKSYCSTPPAVMRRCDVCRFRETVRDMSLDEYAEWRRMDPADRIPSYNESFTNPQTASPGGPPAG